MVRPQRADTIRHETKRYPTAAATIHQRFCFCCCLTWWLLLACGWLMKNVAENKILVSWRSRHFFCSSLFFVRPSWWERKRDYLEQIWRLKKLVQRRKDSETRISAPKKGLLDASLSCVGSKKTSSERKNRKKICLRLPFNHFLSLHFHFQIFKGLTDEPQRHKKSKTFFRNVLII